MGTSTSPTRRRLLAAGTGCLVLATLLFPAVSVAVPRVRGCPIFPSNNQWNLRVDKLPVLGNSRAMIRAIGPNEGLHADFGSGLYQGARIGIPYVTVPG